MAWEEYRNVFESAAIAVLSLLAQRNAVSVALEVSPARLDPVCFRMSLQQGFFPWQVTVNNPQVPTLSFCDFMKCKGRGGFTLYHCVHLLFNN